jgi:ElaB/YqjD/DUF883 family membrane-anchored ribosome-binding protein
MADNADIAALKADLDAVKTDLQSLAQSLAEQGVESARAVGQNVKHNVGAGVDTVENTVHERPFTSLAVAFGAGALTALLLNRRG